MTERRFVLRFNPSEIPELAQRYGYEQDNEALAAGRMIADGHHGIEALKVVVRWKSARIAGFIGENTDVEISRALRFACDPRTSEKSAIETLCGLRGVGIPVASAILTMINPDKYTIVDYRALESLGINKWPETVEFYLEYLQKCRELAREHKTDLRTLDRALWQWSKENGDSHGDCRF